MNELIALIVQKTGISEEQARTSAQTVVGFLKGKLPELIGGQLDTVLQDGSAASNVVGTAAKHLGGMFGR